MSILDNVNSKLHVNLYFIVQCQFPYIVLVELSQETLHTCTCPTRDSSFFSRKSDCLRCAVLLALFVCLTLLASFFHLSLKTCNMI